MGWSAYVYLELHPDDFVAFDSFAFSFSGRGPAIVIVLGVFFLGSRIIFGRRFRVRLPG
jgi:hypothetical protein